MRPSGAMFCRQGWVKGGYACCWAFLYVVRYTLSDATWQMPLFSPLSCDLCGYAKVPQLCNDSFLRPALWLSRG